MAQPPQNRDRPPAPRDARAAGGPNPARPAPAPADALAGGEAPASMSALRLVGRVACLASEGGTIADIAGAALQPLCEEGGWVCAHAYLPISDEALGLTNFYAGEADERIRALCESSRELPMAPGRGMLAAALGSGQPQWTADPARDLEGDRGAMVEAIGLGTVAALPMAHRERVYGLIELFARDSRPPGDERMEALTCVGAVLGGIAARQEAERKLRHTERLVSLGTFAAGIAHEINNPLASILMAARFALKQAGAEDVAQILREIVDDTERCARIVRNVQRVARKLPSDRSRQELNRLVESAAVFARKYAERQGRALAFELTRDALPVHANAAELEQVCISLITNAVQASAPGQEVAVRTARIGYKARLMVEDRGRGMSDEEQRHAFDLFYTTRDREGGTGLGLALAYGIVSDHAGSIDIHSREGRGTRICVDLPLLLNQAGDEDGPCD